MNVQVFPVCSFYFQVQFKVQLLWSLGEKHKEETCSNTESLRLIFTGARLCVGSPLFGRDGERLLV